MKVMTIFGTRPEIIRLSLIIKILDRYSEHVTVHTGQNYHKGLSDIFFDQLGVRQPDVCLDIKSSNFAEQAGHILLLVDRELESHKPDKVLILGDTNSALSAIVAARRGIPVYHMEAGNRCYDDRVPEEVNRRLIDHASTFLMPYTHNGKENLVREGIEPDRIFVTGNPIYEVLKHYQAQIDSCGAVEKYKLSHGSYFLVTLHRAENVDLPERLTRIFDGLGEIAKKYEKPVVVSMHPRTAEKLKTFGIDPPKDKFLILEPLGFFDFVNLQKNAFAVLSDSGTVQEECSILGIPNVTLRDVTERPETIECGSNIISGSDPEAIARCVDLAIAEKPAWQAPVEYTVADVSHTVSKIILGNLSVRKHIS
jgi:UDP-N-acetylglucosamine 2-epimerase (non-hydrolysing)